MAELETGQATAGEPDEKVLEEQTEHIARLHKMSTTAGIATQEYVAINNMAIASAVLGVTTLLALAHWTFLVLGIAGVVCGILAFFQIRDSNGTQGGKGIAVLGILLSLGVSGAVIARDLAAAARTRENERQIAAAIAEVGEQLKKGNVEQAYELLDPEMRKRVPADRWKWFWTNLAQNYGGLTRFEGNGVVVFAELSGGTVTGVTQLILNYQQRQERGEETARLTTYLLQGEDGKWRIYRIVEPFEEAPRPQQPQQGSPAGGGSAPAPAPLPGMAPAGK